MERLFDYEATLHFGEDFPDGRLTAEPTPNSYRPFKLHEVLLEIQRLGRPLTHEEFEKFYVDV